MKAVIVLGSSDLKKEILNEYIYENPIIIGADSGCDVLYKYRIQPDYIIGDFDSISNEAFEYYEKSNVEKILLKKDKNITDGEAAILLARKLGCGKIYLASPLKTKETDQQLGNILLLGKYKGIVLFNNKETIRLVDDNQIKIYKDEGKMFSIIPLNNSVIKIKGSRFDGEFTVDLGDTHTLRNEIDDEISEVSVIGGKALIIQSHL